MVSKKMLSKKVLFLWCLVFVYRAEAGSVKYKDCGSTAEVTELRVTGCTRTPCVLVKGKKYEIEIDAISSSTSKKLPYTVKTNDFLKYTILEGDACKELSKGSCPVSVGQEFTYNTVIDVSHSYPSTEIEIKALVKNDKKQTVICLILDVSIRDKKRSEEL